MMEEQRGWRREGQREEGKERDRKVACDCPQSGYPSHSVFIFLFSSLVLLFHLFLFILFAQLCLISGFKVQRKCIRDEKEKWNNIKNQLWLINKNAEKKQCEVMKRLSFTLLNSMSNWLNFFPLFHFRSAPPVSLMWRKEVAGKEGGE